MFAHSYKVPIVTVMNGTFIVLICVCVGFFFCLRNKRVQKAKKYYNKLWVFLTFSANFKVFSS